MRAAAPAWLPAPRCEGGPADCERAGVDALTLDEGAAGACLVRPAACEPAPPRLAEAGAAIPRRSDSADGAADGGIIYMFVFVVAAATTMQRPNFQKVTVLVDVTVRLYDATHPVAAGAPLARGRDWPPELGPLCTE